MDLSLLVFVMHRCEIEETLERLKKLERDLSFKEQELKEREKHLKMWEQKLTEQSHTPVSAFSYKKSNSYLLCFIISFVHCSKLLYLEVPTQE